MTQQACSQFFLVLLQGFTELDHDMALLVLRLGGRQLLHAIDQRYGLCSTRTLKLLPRTQFAVSHQGFDSKHVASNCSAMLQRTRSFRVMMVDEIAVEAVARYDPATNQLAGLCWQHGRGVDLNINSQAHIEQLHSKVCGQEAVMHLASEATVVGISSVGETDYTCRPIFAAPHCKQGSASHQAALIRAFLNHWCSEGGPHEQYGSLLCFSSDGATIRRQPLHNIFEGSLLQQGSLYDLLSQLPLLDLHVDSIGQLTVNFDEKHLLKRMRTAVISESRGVKIGGVWLYK